MRFLRRWRRGLVLESMGFALRLAKVDRAEIDRKVDQAAELLELTELLDRKPANLSGGQRQRVAMGRAIVRSPQAFLMDEPLSNLDAKLRVQMRTTMVRPQNQLGTATVYVTHDHTEAMTLGDRMAVMRRRPPAGRHARGAVPAATQPVRGRLHRLTGDELPARHAGGRPPAHRAG
jgi:ABC-type sugar transport system ATPase subunit